ncbi:TonB-dependent receptor [Dyadobacter sp. CY323]|uniref:SusC/RagA family TonB-linked outer membrane protein n=1 Tax=Dyadobacter sp. CY323 TaxID=2907302 RepID=UPI001F41664F|nr:TonB-dependent receptor [Dyadobacter sp. CY323]MCE6990500.1 TonB-dependent receptor [Dyadobacter sp. CY323]
MINPLKLKRSVQDVMQGGLLRIVLVILILPISQAFSENLAADRIVRGTVKDAETNAGLPGVNLIIKGSQQGTTTNVDGKYEISVPHDSTVLVISFVGYLSHSVVVGSNNTLDISLKVDQKALDEVVVVGYGTQSRRNVTGSVVKVDMKQTENLPNTNISQALRGRVAGVQFTDSGRPGQGGSILVRGPRSLSGGNNPLIVLDGIFFNGSLADVNPNDIESMEVLKDASAAAIYGSRAANGVILITSKKGTTEKPTIRFNMFTGVSDFAYKVKLLTPERYIQKVLDYRQVAGLTYDPAQITSYLQPSEVENYESGKTTDPWDLVSQKGRINSYDLSISGRSNTTNYYVSAALTNEKGLIFNDNQKRLSLRANLETDVAKWLTIGFSSTFIRRDLSGKEADSPYSVSPYGTPFYEDGEPTQWLVPEDQISTNPIRSALLTRNEEVYTNIFANFYAMLNIPAVEGLTYRVNYSPNYRWQHNYNFFRQDKHFAGNTTSAGKFNREDFDWVLENILTYNRQINENHAFDITLLYGRNHLGFESTTANASQLSSEALGWNDLGLGGILTNTSSAGFTDGLSSMARLNYRIKNKYLLTLTARRDGSSVFAANNKYATFPSGSLAWIASEEPFLKDVPFVDMLKVRASYGAVGNQAISPYQSLSLSSTTRYVYGDGGPSSLGVYPSSMANSDLKWETTYTANFAVDFELFKGRLGGTFELYNMDTRNLLVQRSLPTMTGYNSVWTNLGATNNKGLEFSINSINLRKGKFEWGSNVVFSTNKNKIVHLYQSDTNGDGKEDDDLGNKWFIGQPVNVAYDYIMDGVYQVGDEIPAGFKPGYIRLKDLNGDSKVTAADDRTIVGQMGQPKIRWGVTNNFTYNNLTLSVFVNAMQGWIATLNELDIEYFLSGSGNYPNRPVNRLDAGWWTPENKSNTRPSLGYPNPYLHNYYLSRNFVRIQDVSLTYQVPKNVLSRVKLANARVFVNGKNLATFTKWLGTDPESGGTAKGFPVPRSFTLGLNLGF